ncbi:MAG: sensor domain-containing diguanylate cyclase, partial [bacterium]|nr:sensor domain-containing diguanylate cyclase [bacterium]
MLTLIALPVCWWLQPAPVPHLLPVVLLLLLTALAMLLPVGRLGTRRVRLGSAVVLYTMLLHGACAGATTSLLAGMAAQRLRQREQNDVSGYAPALALSALASGFLYHYGKRSADAVPVSWIDWLRLLAAVGLFVGLRVVLLWWCEGGRRAHLRQVARVEGIVETVTLPTVLAALLAQRQWGWLAVIPICSVGAVGLLAMRALIRAHQAQRQVRALQTLHHRLIAHLHPDSLLQDLGEELRRLLAFDRLSLWSYARHEAHLQNAGVYPQHERASFPAYLQAEGVMGKTLDRRKPLVIADSLRARLLGDVECFTGHLLIIPLAVRDYPWGLLILERSAQREPFVRADYEAIRVVVDHLAMLLENMRLYRQTMEMAARDGLTGLLNHRRLHERLKEEISRSSRYHHPMTLLMIDVDYFKRYNDTYGHQQGDELLRLLAQILQRNVRQSDIVGRY